MANDNQKPTDEQPVPEETAETTPEVVSEPIPETVAPEPIVEEEQDQQGQRDIAAAPPEEEEVNIEGAIPADEAHNTEPTPNPELYTVQAADLNAYPELSQQGVQLHDQVAYNSLYVWKNATAEGDSVVQEVWPRSTGNEKPKGLTFKGE